MGVLVGVDVAAVLVGVGDGLPDAALSAISWARFDTESVSSRPLPTDVSPVVVFTACDCSAVLPLLEAVFFTSYFLRSPTAA